MGPGLPEGAETVRKDTEKPSFFVRLATVIVDKRKLIFFLYACALLFCLFSRNWVSVCNDITEYLPDSTETRQGLTLMEEEFTTFGTARVMVSHVTRGIAEDLAEQIGEIEGVSSASLGDSIGAEEDGEAETPEDIASYFKGADALISVTFAGEEDDESALAAMEAIRELLAPYDFYIDSSVGDSQADSLADEMGILLAVAAVIIVLVLLLTSRSYAEIPVLLLTFIAAALLNLGTNFIFGEISFVSNSVTVVLQLALAIDYAIIMLHRFLEEREHAGDREACIAAVSAAIPSISASSLTTISGLAAMMFMEFQIGFDMGIVLIKSILFSMLSVFTLMPGLLMLFSKAMERTRHRSFIPRIDRWGGFVLKLRHVGVPLFIVALVGGFFLSNRCPYVYGDNAVMTERRNEHQAAAEDGRGGDASDVAGGCAGAGQPGVLQGFGEDVIDGTALLDGVGLRFDPGDVAEVLAGVVSLKRLLNQSNLKSWSSKMIKKSLEAYFFTLKNKIVFCKKQFQNMSVFCFVSTEIV